MHNYDYINKWQKLLTPEVVGLLSQIHEFKGRQNLFIEQKADTLTQLFEIAKIQSTESSNKIEGIYTSDDRLNLLVKDKTTPHTRSEQEIAGYRDVLTTIHASHDYLPVKTSIILQLHRDLYKFSGVGFGGSFKSTDNVISQEDEQGNKQVRFKPVPAWEVSDAMSGLCNSYNEAMSKGNIDPLLLAPMFILDFLCIHPFNDGNGRMSRLLSLLLLYRSDYIVGKYISIEKIIEKSKATYYEVLQDSSYKWHENNNDYEPFVIYMLGTLVAAYREFETRVNIFSTKNVSKPERIAKVIEDTLGKISKKDIMEKCPNISEITIQRTIAELVKNEDIIKLGNGRGTKYIWNREKE
ncbi:MAG: Fic family protein [Oscillospiraceae bacterium]